MSPRVVLMGPPTNPVLQVLYVLVGGVFLVGAVLMGAVILAFVFGCALILGIVFSIRSWWLRRKFANGQPQRSAGNPGPSQAGADRRGTEIIDAEYHVVNESDDPKH